MPKDLVSDSILYLASGGGFYIFDVTDPRVPRKVGELRTPGRPRYINKHDNLLCVGEYEAGVALYDISNPISPVFLGRYITPGVAMGVWFDGRYAYVAAWDKGLRIIDFINPSTPREVGFYDTPGYAMDVVISEEYAYVADAWEGLRIIYIKELSHPIEIGSYVRSNDPAREVRVCDTLAYIAFEEGGLVILNVAEPRQPRELSVIPVGGAMQVAVQESFAYVTPARSNEIKIINVANPSQPRVVGSFPSPSNGEFYGLAVRGKRCYTYWEKSILNALMIIDITEPTTPTLLGSYSGIPVATDVVVAKDSFVFAGTRGQGLKIYNVSNLEEIRQIGQVADSSRVGGIVVRDNYAYLACWNGKIFKVIDISNPEQPHQIGEISRFGYAMGLDIQNNYAYLAENNNLRVILIDDPTQPREVSNLRLPSSAFDVDVEGNYCYVADWGGGIRIIDVSNPNRPVEISSYRTPDAAAHDVKVCYPYLYYADVGGWGIIDISNPTEPREVAYISCFPPNCWGLDVEGNFAYVGRGDSGIKVYNISNPFAPQEVGFYNTPGWTFRVYHYNGKTYVADYDGFCVIEYYGSDVEERESKASLKTLRLQVISSVITRKVIIEFFLPAQRSVRVKLCDRAGRILNTLFMNALSGKTQLEISTEKLSSGIYFIILETNGIIQWTSFVVIK